MLRETSLTFVWKCMVTVAVLACSYSGRVAQTMGFLLLSRVPRPSSAWAGFFHG
jgi:hypothetical protein